MAREYAKKDTVNQLALRRHNFLVLSAGAFICGLLVPLLGFGSELTPGSLFLIGAVIPAIALFTFALARAGHSWVERERKKEVERRQGKEVLGLPPNRRAIHDALAEARKREQKMIDKYLIGYELDTGEPIWIDEDALCTHAAVFAKTGVGKTLWLESIMFQQMLRGRASGLTFIDAKRDMGTLADIIMMAMMAGRIEDLIVIDPFDPVCSYNFVFTTQRADVKARKVLRCGLPPTSDQSTTKHYDRLAADAVYRVVRAMESLGLAWSVRDIAVALSAFNFAYPRLRTLLHESGQKQALVELGHLAGSYRTGKGKIDTMSITDNLRGISSELHSISNAEAGEMFCAPRADLSLTDAILRGKIIYYMLPRLEEAESAARMVKVFREDLEVSIGEITSNRNYRLEDPHMVIIDEGASTFGPTWANLFELARKGRFALLFGAQSVGGLMDTTMGLSEQFYERVIANVNLKVIMRVGDNRTAMDMSEWIGKVTLKKTSINTAATTGISDRELTKNLKLNRRSSDQLRDGITIQEDEDDLVSPEELKHEMSAEKGLAWFDLGDGRLRKGRATWFNGDLPEAWDGRDFLVRYETVEADEIGLAEWVDEHILSMERSDAERDADGAQSAQGGGQPNAPAQAAQGSAQAAQSPGAQEAEAEDEKPEESGPFRFNMMRGFRGKPRARTFVSEVPDQTQQSAEEEHNSQDAQSADEPPTSNAEKKASKEPHGASQNEAAEQGNADSAPKEKEAAAKPPKGGGKPRRGGLNFGPRPQTPKPKGSKKGKGGKESAEAGANN